jgi:hypothetical protein
VYCAGTIWVVSERGDFCGALVVLSGTKKAAAGVMAALIRDGVGTIEAPEDVCYDYIGRKRQHGFDMRRIVF